MAINQPIAEWIITLFKHHERYLTEKLRKFNLKSREANLLLYLKLHGDGVNQDKIAEDLGVNKATISRGIKILVENGYVLKKQSHDDKRQSIIYLIEKAINVLPEIIAAHNNWFALLFEDVPENEKEIILYRLEQAYEKFRYNLV